MKKKKIFLIIIILVVLAVTLFLLLNIKNKNNSNKLNIERLYEYGEYIESLDIPPNTIVARINGEEILFHEIESYRYSINYSIENGSEESIGKNAFYEVLTNKLAAYMAKEYPDASNYNLNIDNNLEKTKNEWLYGYGEYTVEEARERWLKVLYVEKDEIWLDEDDWITYLQNRSVEMMLTSKGNSIIFDFIFDKPELANDKLLEEKIAKYNDIKEQQKKYMDEGKQEEALELYSQTGKLLTELREIYEKDLILNSNIELCVDKNELSYTVPIIYGKKEDSKQENEYIYNHFNISFKNGFDLVKDMTYENKIYHMVIDNYEQYLNFKNNDNAVYEMKETDFENNFMIITAVENTSMLGLTVSNIYNKDSKLIIELNDFPEGEEYDENLTAISIVLPRTMKREIILVNDVRNANPNKYYWENTSTEGLKKITEEQAIETAKKYAKDLETSDSLVGKYLKDYNKVFSVTEKKYKPNNYWYITEGILERKLETADFEREVYEIILVSEQDEMEIERAYFYVDVYTNCVIAGHYTSD